MRRALTAAATATALVLSTTACSLISDAEPVTITWWDTSDAKNEAPAFKALVKDFENTHPGIKVTYVNVPFTDAQTRFQTAAAAKKAPDVLRADVGWIPGFAKAGYLAPLDGTPAEPDDFYFDRKLIRQATYKEHLYGVPQTTDTLAFMYNKNLFTKAGIADTPVTWDDLKADMAKIKERTGADGFAFNPQAYFAMPFLFGEGTDLVDADYERITVNSPEAVKGIETLVSVLKAPGARKLDTTDKAYANIMNAFSNGKVASIIQGPWETANLFKGAAFADKENLGIAKIPGGSFGHGAPLGGHNLVASSTSSPAQQSASQKFIAFMTSASAQEKIALTNGTLPTRMDAFTAKVVFRPEIAAFHLVLKDGVPRQPIPEYTALYAAMEPNLVNILTGRVTAQQGLKKTSDQALQLLPDYRTS
ncbi:extracellular solute-binding protein [Streptomyces sp. NPDC088915]|uniref:extracellular solute-binding protein n=1 Tax=Streptomyces sp. NPDC088915 TaxID=3365912 RepID=UPI0038270577